MNCYNGATYLRQAIESVLAQSYENWEVIFWDNQSADDSAAIFKSYKDPRLRYYYAPRHTVLAEARNCALPECRGDLIAFLDVDDWWVPEKLQLQVPLFHDEGVGMCCGNYVTVNERPGAATPSKTAYRSLPFGHVLDELFADPFVHFSTFVVRKKAIEGLPYAFDSRFNIIEDFDLLVRLSVDWKMASVQAPIAFYRWHQTNTGYRTDFLISDEYNVWFDEAKHNPNYTSRKHFVSFAARVNLYDVLRVLYLGKRREAWRRRKNVNVRHRLKICVALLLPTRMVRSWIDRS